MQCATRKHSPINTRHHLPGPARVGIDIRSRMFPVKLTLGEGEGKGRAVL